MMALDTYFCASPLFRFPGGLSAQLAVEDKERMKNELAAAGLTKLPVKNRLAVFCSIYMSGAAVPCMSLDLSFQEGPRG